jgi:drug/metabolite transporter (DMT)-like permease
MKWWVWLGLLIAFIAVIFITGYRGGAKDAAANYNKILRPQEVEK